MKRALEGVTIIKSNRQPNNLKRMLTKAAFKPQTTFKVNTCMNKRCQLCRDNLIEGQSYYFERTNYLFKVNGNMDCNTRNCVYVIKCNGCSKIYIGETSNFRLRVNLHKDHIRQGENAPLYVNRHISD